MRTEADTLERLRGRLVADAQAEGLIDVAYRTVDSPIGSLLLAATEQGLVRLAFANEDHDVVLESLASTVSPRILRTPARLDTAARELDQYFEGRRWRFDVPLDFRLSRGFRLSVLEHLVAIGFGQTESYTEVAAAVGNPKAVRAAGTACATNPLPVIVPCHRVVRSDGSFGNYLGGVEAKRYLLDFERRTATAGSAR
ncbi:MAG: methylated-DNA--[protein]-cysteine S-methyltransferase [Nocardiaceae bacterium]|nr:methylated-DNA--[protein]-cysteine S-methyltransferase [Nocardiaceae bacterium]